MNPRMKPKSAEELAREYFNRWINQRSARIDAIMKESADLLAAQHQLHIEEPDLEKAFLAGHASREPEIAHEVEMRKMIEANRDQLRIDKAELTRENAQLREALEKIADPRKRDHKEPDAYTTLGCVMHIADEALAKYPAPSEGT